MTETQVRKMERDAFELAKEASKKYQYSQELQDRLVAILLINFIQKCGLQNYDYNDLLRNLETQSTTVPIIYDAGLSNAVAYTQMDILWDNKLADLKIEQRYGPNSWSYGTIGLCHLDHEWKHLLNSYHKQKKQGKNTLTVRTGFRVRKEIRGWMVTRKGVAIEEAHTVKECLKLESTLNLLSNYQLRYLNIERIKEDNPSIQWYYQESGYHNLCEQIKPLLTKLDREMEEASYYGEMNDFEKYFYTKYHGVTTFRQFSSRLDQYFEDDQKLQNCATQLSPKRYKDITKRYTKNQAYVKRVMKTVQTTK